MDDILIEWFFRKNLEKTQDFSNQRSKASLFLGHWSMKAFPCPRSQDGPSKRLRCVEKPCGARMRHTTAKRIWCPRPAVAPRLFTWVRIFATSVAAGISDFVRLRMWDWIRNIPRCAFLKLLPSNSKKWPSEPWRNSGNVP